MRFELVADVVGPASARQIVEAVFEEAWNSGQVASLRGHVDPGLTFHYRGQTFTTSLDELEALVGAWRSAFPDLHLKVCDLVEDGDLIAARLRVTGTHRGQWQETAPTGRRVEFDEMMFFRFEGGLLVEAWEVQDELGLLQQIGAVRA